MKCVVCDVPISVDERAAERHNRTRDHLCNIVYDLWLDPEQIWDGDEPFTCHFCYDVCVFALVSRLRSLMRYTDSFVTLRSATYRVDWLQGHFRRCSKNPDRDGVERVEDTDEDECEREGDIRVPEIAPAPPQSFAPQSAGDGTIDPADLGYNIPAEFLAISQSQNPDPVPNPVQLSSLSLTHASSQPSTSSSNTQRPSTLPRKPATRSADISRHGMTRGKQNRPHRRYHPSALREVSERVCAVDALFQGLKHGKRASADVPSVLQRLHESAASGVSGVDQATVKRGRARGRGHGRRKANQKPASRAADNCHGPDQQTSHSMPSSPPRCEASSLLTSLAAGPSSPAAHQRPHAVRTSMQDFTLPTGLLPSLEPPEPHADIVRNHASDGSGAAGTLCTPPPQLPILDASILADPVLFARWRLAMEYIAALAGVRLTQSTLPSDGLTTSDLSNNT